MLATLRTAARRLRHQATVLYLVARDPRTPWAARLVAGAVAAYALSPIDLVPDFIPVLGLLDDLVLVPLGVALALRLVPARVLADARPGRRARSAPGEPDRRGRRRPRLASARRQRRRPPLAPPLTLSQVLTFVLIPAAATVLGGVAAAFRPPGRRLLSVIQHVAAGVVFAAVAGELLPELMYQAAPLPTVLGFALGVGLMLGVKRLTEGGPAEGVPEESAEADGTRGLVTTVAVDVAIDGLLVGVSFAAGTEAGIVLTIALSLEVLFLALATAAALTGAGASRGRVVGTTLGLAVLLVLGAAAGGLAAGALSGGALAALLAFGVAALLYLVTEELLVEAHETEDTPLVTATFFAGFLALLLLEMAL